MPGKEGFKYVYAAAHIEEMLDKIQHTGRPDKLTITYAKNTWLFTNSQYSAVIELLKDMEFLDSSNAPTEIYAQYQNPAIARKVLAESIKKAYPSLFKAYPTANSISDDVLRGYIRQQTGEDRTAVNRVAATFKKLCSLADFSNDTQEASQPVVEAKQQEMIKTVIPSTPFVPITMNIQIVIPSDATAEQYDKIFSSLKKFLMK